MQYSQPIRKHSSLVLDWPAGARPAEADFSSGRGGSFPVDLPNLTYSILDPFCAGIDSDCSWAE